MTSETVRVALVGAGLWGKNLLRVLAAHPRVSVTAVVDPSAEALERARALVPRARLGSSLDEALELADAVVVATPADRHAEPALRALARGRDVLVEKPLATSPADADAIVTEARKNGRVAMVGHLLLHHPAVVRLVALATSGELGRLRYVASARRSPPSPERASTSVLWSLGPHDLAVLHALDPAPLASAASATLAADARGLPQAVALHARLASGLAAEIELSSVHAMKERRMVVVGDEAVAIFDDLAADELVVARVDRSPSPHDLDAAVRRARPVPIETREPLAVEIDHFIACVRTRSEPRTSVEEGALVVRWLAKAAETPFLRD